MKSGIFFWNIFIATWEMEGYKYWMKAMIYKKKIVHVIEHQIFQLHYTYIDCYFNYPWWYRLW